MDTPSWLVRPRSTLRVFLSSTSVDLKKHRAAVRRVIETFDEHPVVMEDFGAHDGDAKHVSLDKVDGADVYILLLAWHYGTLPDGETLAVTHQEYRRAKETGKPRLIFVADARTEDDDGPDAIFPATARDPQHAAELLAFREEVGRDHVYATFTTPESAALAVAAALHNLIQNELPAPAGPHPLNNLPPRAPEFVGRAHELREVCERLRAGKSVGLSTLVAGLAGVGKSALAAEALDTLAREPATFPGGITWICCDEREGLSGLTWIYDQLLADWGTPLSPEQLAQAQTNNPETEAELRERALQTRFRAFALPNATPPPALVLLDNVDVRLPLGRALDTLSSLGITALVTARHQPSVSRLQLLPLDVLDAATAVQLFSKRYRAKGGAWDDTRDTDPARAVVERLGRLPLAIELQAARAALRKLSTSQLNANLEQDNSQGLLGDPLDATRNMRYSFDQSLKTLTPIQRARFAALGLPEGHDWPRIVIERLLVGIQEQRDTSGNASNEADGKPSASERISAQADLDRFVELSLATPLEPDGRVRLHPLLREYAHERWQEMPPAVQHEGLRALLAGIDELVKAQAHDFAAIACEEEMIVGALDQAHATRIAPQHVSELINALEDYLNLGGHWRIGARLFSWQLAAYREAGNRWGEAAALSSLGQLSYQLGDTEQARGYFERALAIQREVGNRQDECTTLNNLGILADSLGQREQARGYFEQALVGHRKTSDRREEAATLNNLGMLAHRQGNMEQARGYFERALAIQREVGNRQGEGVILNNLGMLAKDQGQETQACRYFEQSLAIKREIADRRGESATLNNLGLLTERLGEKTQARGYYEQALTINREVGNRAMEGTILNNLGGLAESVGEKTQARGYYEQALAIHRDVGNREEEGITLNNLGQLAERAGQKSQAQRYLEQALAIAREVGNRSSEGTTLNNLGNLARHMGHPEQARTYYEQALGILRDIGDVDHARVAAKNLARLAASGSSSDSTPVMLPSIPHVNMNVPHRKWRWLWSR